MIPGVRRPASIALAAVTAGRLLDFEKSFGIANGGTGGDAFGNSSGLLERATQAREQDGIFVKPRP